MSFPQPGVIRPPDQQMQQPARSMPEHLILVALDFEERTSKRAREALERLNGLVRAELTSQLADPATETGELGYTSGYVSGQLTITLGISAGGFECLGVTGNDGPGDLRPIPWDDLGDDPRTRASGDLLLQICSDDIFVCEHVARRVEKELRDVLVVVWSQVGVQRFDSTQPVSPLTNRALIGFLDATHNLHPRSEPADRRLVLVDPGEVANYPQHPPSSADGTGPSYPADLAPVPTFEPDWTRNGSYLKVRVSLFDTTRWDELTKHAQERAVGQFKVSGMSLDLEDEVIDELPFPRPAYADDQSNLAVPVTAHVRKASPQRSTDDCDRKEYRHGYSVVCAENDRLYRGLAFMSFGRTISTQFEFVLRAQMRNPDFPYAGAGKDELLDGALSEIVLCGGYYFTPAIREPEAPWTWVLPF